MHRPDAPPNGLNDVDRDGIARLFVRLGVRGDGF